MAELDPRVEYRVYLRDGFAISLWTYYEPAGSEIAPAEYAGALMRLHAALRQIDLGAPHFTDRVAIAFYWRMEGLNQVRAALDRYGLDSA